MFGRLDEATEPLTGFKGIWDQTPRVDAEDRVNAWAVAIERRWKRRAGDRRSCGTGIDALPDLGLTTWAKDLSWL